eukprot:gene13940-29672_t
MTRGSNSFVNISPVILNPPFIPANIVQSLNPLDLMNAQIEINKFDSESFQNVIRQCQRARFPLTIEIMNNPSLRIVMTSIPVSSNIPLHSRPRKIFAQVLYGEIISQEIDIINIENECIQKNNYVDVSHEDVFAQGTDDCVCRGGKCPRRHGCIFWVEKQMRDNGAYLKGKIQHRKLYKSNSNFNFQDTETIPREYITNENPSAIVEIIINEEELIQDVPHIQYYKTDKILNSLSVGDEVSVFATDNPLGYIPSNIPWNI